jgi:hypothetical protein
MHGNQVVLDVANEAEVMIVMGRMLLAGKTNILVVREDSVVTVTQIDRPDPLVPVEALTLIRYDVVLQRG